jgi:predicted sulfurtransferase
MLSSRSLAFVAVRTIVVPFEWRLLSSIPTSGSMAVRMQVPTPTDATELQMLSFYKFHEISNPVLTRDALFDSLMDLPGLRGTLYVAAEGINAQVAVPPIHLDAFLSTVRGNLPCTVNPNLGNVVNLELPTFDRFIVRTRNAVLRDGLASALDWENAGDELKAEQWHGELRNAAPSLLLDCRNAYESEYGSFRGALPLDTDVFSESWERLEELTADVDKDAPVHIFCTGGIRCVKVGAFLKQRLGFKDVRRLEHGIIGYEKWANENSAESIWEGENFLFDKRRILDAKDERMEQNSDGTDV